jgi:quercetin dioxygenase-like cupin family protein
MVKVSSKTSTLSKEEKEPGTSSFRTYDLPMLVKEIKKSKAFEKGELNSMTLLKSPEKQIVLTALHEGTEINSFQTNDSITFQIIEGKLVFYANKESVTLEMGQMMTVQDKVKYSLTTWEDTVFLLTIATSI